MQIAEIQKNYFRIRAEKQAKVKAKAEAERVEALKRVEVVRREEQRRRLEADTEYTQTLQRRLQEGEPDHSKLYVRTTNPRLWK